MTTNTCTCGRPTAGAWLCDRCQRTFAVAIANIAAYWNDLDTVETKRTRYGSSTSIRGSIGKSQPLPPDGRFLDRTGRGTQAKWDTWNTVVAWCRTVMEESPRRFGPVCALPCLHTSCAAVRRTAWPRNTISGMCAYLDRQFRWIVREAWAPDMLDELLDVERRLVRLINRPADRWYAGKCSATDETGNYCPTELYATVDRGTVTCPSCDTRHDVAERRDFLLAEAKDYLVTATEAAGALLAWTDYDGTETKLIDRIRKWRDREKLEVRDVTSLQGRDRHLYRLGDVQELLVEHAQREQRRRIGA